MDPLARYASTRTGSTPTSIQATNRYITGHLQSDREGGDLKKELLNYLSRDGRVIPMFHRPELWRLVGLRDTEMKDGVIPQDLVTNLLKGLDRSGNPMGRRTQGGFRRPKELLLTIPCEVSEQLKRIGNGSGLAVLEAMAEEALDQLEQACCRVSRGSAKDKGRLRWASGEVMALIFVHGTERTGQAHHHAHVLLFPLARTSADGIWRAL